VAAFDRYSCSFTSMLSWEVALWEIKRMNPGHATRLSRRDPLVASIERA